MPNFLQFRFRQEARSTQSGLINFEIAQIVSVSSTNLRQLTASLLTFPVLLSVLPQRQASFPAWAFVIWPA